MISKLLSLAVGLALILNAGCMATHATMCKARTEKAGKRIDSPVENHAWLALLPFAVVFDVATSPVQMVCFLYAFNDHSHCSHSQVDD